MGTHKIYSGIQGIRDKISGSLYGDCHELLAKVLVKLMNHQFSCCRFANDNVTAMLVDEKEKRFPTLVS